ncbi:DUF5700 domain-containing putative Zn-dependent protease [Shewanella waksmanii]|uniref:DUF5700 domain-containing putative Zn-dependent protease n=1 Tax=Shewanella waksmanii TaxID=213783 RepID=UPI00048C6F35|nr:DUF5700 domain-containing putative Zn-dependent protease [Shewanella waksmanii]
MKYLGLAVLLLLSMASHAKPIHSDNRLLPNEPLVNAQARLYDFTAVAKLQPLVAQLKQGQTVSESQWQALYALPAYQLIFTISSHRPEQLTRRYQVAFNPNERSAFEALAESEQFEVLHLRQAFDDLSWLPQYQHWLVEQDALARSKAHALALLPSFDANAYEVRFMFALFGQNAHAAEIGVVMDAYIGYLSDQQAPFELAGHELHHFFYGIIHPVAPLDMSNPFERVLYHVQKEGVANLIDKHNFSDADSPFAESLKQQFAKQMSLAPDHLALLDRLLTAALDEPQQADFMTFQQALPFWGHTLGWYICQTIVKAGESEALIITLNQPHQLFTLYNQVVEQHQLTQPRFSQAVLDYYELLSQQ